MHPSPLRAPISSSHASTPPPHADTHDVLEEVHYGIFVLGPAVLRLLGQGAIVGGSGRVVSILKDRGRRLEGQRRSYRDLLKATGTVSHSLLDASSIPSSGRGSEGPFLLTRCCCHQV